MKTYRNLFSKLCSYENLELAFKKAKKRKSLKPYVVEFEKDLKENLLQLSSELLLCAYRPKPLKTFILKDPKTRKISVSHFRDRVVHHAICNIIEPLLDKRFIHDSYANRKFKGVHAAIKRFDYFKRKVSKNGKKIKIARNNSMIRGYALKADIKHYFDTVDHQILMRIMRNKVNDIRLLWLIKVILNNHKTMFSGKGMPLGNMTSQFFANVYLNELDQFVKHKLKVKYYLRYVDDFVVLHASKLKLEQYKTEINKFLNKELKLELHPEKCKTVPLYNGVSLLGFRVFYHFKLLRKRNLNKLLRRLEEQKQKYKQGVITKENILESFQGWSGYASTANTYRLRRRILEQINGIFLKPASSALCSPLIP